MSLPCPVCKNDENPKYDAAHSEWCRVCVAAEFRDQAASDTRRQTKQFISSDGVTEK
jgi:hypothetical protein